MAGTGHPGSSGFQLPSNGVASALFELHEVAHHSSATRGFRFMGWDCNGGDVSAGVLCRALRRAARAPPSTQTGWALPNLRVTPRHPPPEHRQPPGWPVPVTPQTSEAAASFQLARDLLSPAVRVRYRTGARAERPQLRAEECALPKSRGKYNATLRGNHCRP